MNRPASATLLVIGVRLNSNGLSAFSKRPDIIQMESKEAVRTIRRKAVPDALFFFVGKEMSRRFPEEVRALKRLAEMRCAWPFPARNRTELKSLLQIFFPPEPRRRQPEAVAPDIPYQEYAEETLWAIRLQLPSLDRLSDFAGPDTAAALPA